MHILSKCYQNAHITWIRILSEISTCTIASRGWYVCRRHFTYGPRTACLLFTYRLRIVYVSPADRLRTVFALKYVQYVSQEISIRRVSCPRGLTTISRACLWWSVFLVNGPFARRLCSWWPCWYSWPPASSQLYGTGVFEAPSCFHVGQTVRNVL